MKSIKAASALGLMTALALCGTQRAGAFANANLDLTVSFSGTLSVIIDEVQYSTRALGALGASSINVPASSATVRNNGTVTGKWQLSVADASYPGAGADVWSVITTTGLNPGGASCVTAGCPGHEEFALQALFISSAATAGCPVNTASDWDTFVSTVGSSGTTYIAGRYADTTFSLNGGTGNPDNSTAGATNGNMYVYNATNGVGKRGLCVRLIMPATSDTSDTHIIRTTLTAAAGG